MNFTEVERVIVELGVLSTVKRDEKISTYDQSYISVQEPIPLWTPLMRWLYGDKKTRITERLNELINKTDHFLLDARLRVDLRQQLLEQLVRSCPGLANQMHTYVKNKVEFQQLRVIMKKVLTILEREGEDTSELKGFLDINPSMAYHRDHIVPSSSPSEPKRTPSQQQPAPAPTPEPFSVFSRAPQSQSFTGEMFYRPSRLGEPSRAFDPNKPQNFSEEEPYPNKMEDLE